MFFNITMEEEKIDPILSLEKKLSADRKEWTRKIDSIIQQMKNVSAVPEIQVYMLSYRQMLVDEMVTFQYTIFRKNADYDVQYKSKFLEYLNTALKLNGTERDKMVKADMNIINRQLSILDAHLNFYKECVKTLDNLAFAIRNRIRVEEDF